MVDPDLLHDLEGPGPAPGDVGHDLLRVDG
jgi:hypothetical protein